MRAHVLEQLKDSFQAVICQSFGMGGLPGLEEDDFALAIQSWLNCGKTFVVMTQVPYEGSNMSIYQVGQQVKNRFPILEAYNMTTETAVTKLMWILGQTRQSERVEKMFYCPVQYDIICT